MKKTKKLIVMVTMWYCIMRYDKSTDLSWKQQEVIKYQ